MSREIILASGSPRRTKQLKDIGLDFQVMESQFVEQMEKRGNPERLAEENALGKAKTVANKIEKGIVIGADTIVVLNSRVMGKPKSVKEARDMLHKISGKKVYIITGLAIVDVEEQEALTDVVVTETKIKKLEEQEIDSYVACGEPLDKAGAFAIQGKGAFMVEWIKGDYHAAVRLPLFALIQHLRKFGVTIF